MALVHKNRVKETATTVGTGTYTLLGAVAGFQAFSAIGNTNTCFYFAEDGTNWEVGIGTYTLAGTTLARTTILASSNAGAAVSWGAGTKNIGCGIPAEKFYDSDAIDTLLAGKLATPIAAGMVTLAMMANMATASLIYRKTAASGVPEVNTLATLKTDLGLTGTNSGDQSAASILASLITVDGAGSGLDADTIDGIDSAAITQNTVAQVLTNKEINPRIGTVASSSTPSPLEGSHDQFNVTAAAANMTVASPGSGVEGQKLVIRFKDNATARTIAWNAIFRAGTDVPLPTTTVISKTLYCGFIFNGADTKWDLVAVTGNI